MSKSKKKSPVYKDHSMSRKMRSGITRAKIKAAIARGKEIPVYKYAVNQYDVSEYSSTYWYGCDIYLSDCCLAEYEGDRLKCIEAQRQKAMRK